MTADVLWISEVAWRRFWTKVEFTGFCWLWTRALNSKGYGSFRTGGKHHLADRFAYELLVGFIPDDLQLDHLCRIHNCVNPDHVEPVTPAVNSQRGFAGLEFKIAQLAKTHCPAGHPYDEVNTYRRLNGQRMCRECHRESNRLYARRARQQVGAA